MIKHIILIFLLFLFAVFVYMIIGATIIELFLILLRKMRKNKFIIFLIDKVLIEKEALHPNFEMILWCTIFWPILLLFFIIIIPTIGFSYVIEKIFNKVESLDLDDDDKKEKVINEKLNN